MIDRAKAAAVAAEVSNGLQMANTVAADLIPQYAAFSFIGQALAQFEPTIVDDAIALINKDEPTDQELADFHAKLAALKDPGSI